MLIENQSVTPKYLQLKQIIKEAILQGEFVEQLPAERELADKYNISYMTVRRAIGELVEEGVLYREAGRGTFVCPPGKISRKTFNIAFVLPPKVRDGIANVYYSHVFRAVQKTSAEYGYRVMVTEDMHSVFPLDNGGSYKAAGRKVDGIIAVVAGEVEFAIDVARFMPLVLVDSGRLEIGVPTVDVNNEIGACMAVKHLIELGHTRIGHVAGRSGSSGPARLSGYAMALSEAGIPYDGELVFQGDQEFESGCNAAGYYLGLPSLPSAIFCANDVMALGLMREFARAGVKIPEQVSVMGFDDITAATFAYPSLSTIRVPKMEIGRTAVQEIISLINGKKSETKNTYLEPVLVERESTASPTK